MGLEKADLDSRCLAEGLIDKPRVNFAG